MVTYTQQELIMNYFIILNLINTFLSFMLLVSMACFTITYCTSIFNLFDLLPYLILYLQYVFVFYS